MQKALAKISKFGKFLKTLAKETLALVLRVCIGLTTILLMMVLDRIRQIRKFCAQIAIITLINLVQDVAFLLNGSVVSIKLGGKHLFLDLRLDEKEDEILPRSLILDKKVVVLW